MKDQSKTENRSEPKGEDRKKPKAKGTKAKPAEDVLSDDELDAQLAAEDEAQAEAEVPELGERVAMRALGPTLDRRGKHVPAGRSFYAADDAQAQKLIKLGRAEYRTKKK